MQRLLSDLRFALRLFRTHPGFTLVAVLTLALGIAANTTVFGWVNSVLLNPFPGVARSGELTLLQTVTSDGRPLNNNSYLDYRDYRDHLQLISGLAASRFTPVFVGPEGHSERAFAELVSLNYFELLGVRPILGPGIRSSACQDQPETCPLVVLNHRFWLSHFNGAPDIIGRKIRINRREFTIAGVAPPEFQGGMNGLTFDLWVPLNWAEALGTGGGTLNFRGTRDLTSVFARLKPSVPREQAEAEVVALAAQLAQIYPETNRGILATLTSLHVGGSGAQQLLSNPLRILSAISFILLLIVCANVCNLLLARSVSRRREFGVRLALGSGPTRLARQLLTETLLLALLGSAAGIILSLWLKDTLLLLLPQGDFPVSLTAPLDSTTLIWSLLLGILVTVLTGTVPALFAARSSLNETLKEESRTTSGHSHRLRSLLVVTEVALATVALIGAGLFLQSFRNAQAIDPGFHTDDILVGQFYLSAAGYTGRQQREFCIRLREALEAQPGITGVSYSDTVPFSFGLSPWHQVTIGGYTPAPGENLHIHRSLVPPGHFGLLGIPLLEGRNFTAADDTSGPRVVIINQTFARRFFAGRIPVGNTIQIQGNPLTIVGIVRDTKYHNPAEAPLPYMYIPFAQRFAPGLNFNFFVKSPGDPSLAAAALRAQAKALNPDASVYSIMPLAEAGSSALYPQKVAASLLGVLGGVALFLAALGLFSVMAYAVTERTREVGLRMALGARPTDVLSMVVRQGAVLVLPGLLIGAAAAAFATRWAGSLLVNVRLADPLIYSAAVLFLALVALAACLLPALRAARTDPLTTLRTE
jgi:predicted permease